MRNGDTITAYIGLGANIGDRAANLFNAVAELSAAEGVTLRRVSKLIETPAVGGPTDSPPYFNGAAEIETTLGSHALMKILTDIEKDLGRVRRIKWEPRTVDLDLLLVRRPGYQQRRPDRAAPTDARAAVRARAAGGDRAGRGASDAADEHRRAAGQRAGGEMKVARTIAEFRAERAKVGRLALVPTMGALHEGHLSLMRLGKQHAPHVAATIFVNPTQFGPKEDFTKYPRPLEADLKMCESVGVELVFAPEAAEMYPPDSPKVLFDLPELTTVLEGAHRPGHFAGVCQVVAKLFNITQPDVAIFGRKDFQQLTVLTAMTAALDWPIEIVAGPTVREPGGLAMSSRNRYLSDDERQRAMAISRSLFFAEAQVKSGRRDASAMLNAMREMLLAQQMQIDYVAAVEPKTLRPTELITGPVVFTIAARVGTTRLIDNLLVDP